ncbi:MAG: hypothetical protein RIF32_19655, partial [Leptospirales bacterium]
MPPPFPLYLLISSAFATGFFVLLGLILSALVRWNTTDFSSGAALLFYAAFMFTGVLRIIKDAWAYWPYAFHSGKFLRHNPNTGGGVAWLRLSPGLAAVLTAALFVCLSAYASSFAGIGFAQRDADAQTWLPASGTVAREFLFWIPGVVLVPAILFALMFGFGLMFVRSYAKFAGPAAPISASRALLRGWVFPEALAFLSLNAAILWPLGQAAAFSLDRGLQFGVLASGAALVAFSSAALWLSIVAPATPALTGAVFSRLWRLEGIENLRTPVPLPEAGAFSFRFRDYFAPVFAANLIVFVAWRVLALFMPESFASLLWLL